MNIIAYLILIPAAFIGICLYGMYYKGKELQGFVNEAFANLDLYLQEKWDLTTKLTDLAQNFVKDEVDLLEKIKKIKEKDYGSLPMEEKISVFQELFDNIKILMELSSKYPDLKNSSGFVRIEDDFMNIDENISKYAKIFNNNIKEFNKFLSSSTIKEIAPLFKFKKMDLFEIKN